MEKTRKTKAMWSWGTCRCLTRERKLQEELELPQRWLLMGAAQEKEEARKVDRFHLFLINFSKWHTRLRFLLRWWAAGYWGSARALPLCRRPDYFMFVSTRRETPSKAVWQHLLCSEQSSLKYRHLQSNKQVSPPHRSRSWNSCWNGNCQRKKAISIPFVNFLTKKAL